MSVIVPPDLLNADFANSSIDHYYDKQKYCDAKRLIRNINPKYSGVAPPYTGYWGGDSFSRTYGPSGSALALGYPGYMPQGKYFHLGKTKCGRYGPAWLGNCNLTHEYEIDFGRSPFDYNGTEPYFTKPVEYGDWDPHMGYYTTGYQKPGSYAALNQKPPSPRLFVKGQKRPQHGPYGGMSEKQFRKKAAKMAKRAAQYMAMADKSGCSPCQMAKQMAIQKHLTPSNAQMDDYEYTGEYSGCNFGLQGELNLNNHPPGVYKYENNLGHCACLTQAPYLESAYEV